MREWTQKGSRIIRPRNGAPRVPGQGPGVGQHPQQPAPLHAVHPPLQPTRAPGRAHEGGGRGTGHCSPAHGEWFTDLLNGWVLRLAVLCTCLLYLMGSEDLLLSVCLFACFGGTFFSCKTVELLVFFLAIEDGDEIDLPCPENCHFVSCFVTDLMRGKGSHFDPPPPIPEFSKYFRNITVSLFSIDFVPEFRGDAFFQ